MKKILIIRFSSIGDIVLTTPVLRCLKKQVEDVEIHFLTKKSFQSILSNNPYIDKIWLFDKNLKSLIKELKSEGFDEIIDLHKNIRTQKIKNKLDIKSTSFNKLNAEKWLLTNLKINKLPKIHIIERYMATVKHLDVKYDGNGLDFYIDKKDDYNCSKLPAPFQQGFYAMVVGAAHITKSPTVDLCAKIITNLDYPVVLIGGPDDEEKAKEILKLTKTFNVVNLVGNTNIGQSASVILQSKLVITPDTGMMHISAALNKPLVCIWGNTVPEFGMYPFYPDNQNMFLNIEVKNLSCRPCSKIGFDKCPKQHFKCINDISPSKVIKEINKLRLQ